MNILDCTVRDGSYAVDFKFTCTDVKNLVSRAVKLGIEYIEIGHGMGLHASSIEHGEALHSDWEYLAAAKEVGGKAKIGFFCIPGIARREDLAEAKKNGVAFVRVGVNADRYEEALPYIYEAKKLGLGVMTNYMKSYVLTPVKFAEAAARAQEAGADSVYLVDSAGYMHPAMLKGYIAECRERSSVKLGFHGHNNMGLAVSNTVFCVKQGLDFIDCSFQGLGRSLGNASLEQVVMALKHLDYEINMDIPRLLEYGYSGLRNIVGKELMHPLDMVCGYAGFHSGYLKYIYKCCVETQVDPLRLIIAYSSLDQAGLDYEKLCQVAAQLPKDIEDNPYHFNEYFSVKYYE